MKPILQGMTDILFKPVVIIIKVNLRNILMKKQPCIATQSWFVITSTSHFMKPFTKTLLQAELLRIANT